MSLRFILSHPAVSTTIVGMRKPEHVRQNIAVSDAGPLDKSSSRRTEEASLGPHTAALVGLAAVSQLWFRWLSHAERSRINLNDGHAQPKHRCLAPSLRLLVVVRAASYSPFLAGAPGREAQVCSAVLNTPSERGKYLLRKALLAVLSVLVLAARCARAEPQRLAARHGAGRNRRPHPLGQNRAAGRSIPPCSARPPAKTAASFDWTIFFRALTA